MKSLILHTTCLYAAIILMMAGMMQYSHHHHHVSPDNAEIIFNCSGHACHHNPFTEDESDSTHCALHLAQMMSRDEVSVGTDIPAVTLFDVVLYPHNLSSPNVIDLIEYDEIEIILLLRSKMFVDYAFSRGSPAAILS
ncbi:MAG: hypothetical protein K2H74_08270 [Paramuribaculum sp.]|nr:hypothetical protein [Paramuribaculum sp.]